MYDTMPVIHFNPAANFERNKADYECPLYKTATRAGVLSTTGASSNFVVAVETSRPPDGHGRTGIQTIGMDAW